MPDEVITPAEETVDTQDENSEVDEIELVYQEFTLKVADSGTEHNIEANTDHIYVHCEILDENGDVVVEHRFGFDLDTDSDSIKEDLQKFLQSYQQDQDFNVAEQKANKLRAKAQETITDLKDLEISGTVK